MKEWVLYSVLAILAWGAWGFLPKCALSSIEPGSALIYEVLGAAFTGLLVFALMRPELGAQMQGIVPAVLTGVTGCLGLLFFMYALRTGKVCVIAPLTALYPVVTVAFGLIFLKEKINVVQMAGVALAVVSVMLITHE